MDLKNEEKLSYAHSLGGLVLSVGLFIKTLTLWSWLNGMLSEPNAVEVFS